MTKIDRREDVTPKEGLHEYGNVEFADPTNKKYPIDTPEHVRAAWSYIQSYATQMRPIPPTAPPKIRDRFRLGSRTL